MLAAFGSNGIASAQTRQSTATAPTVTANQIRQLQNDETKKAQFLIVDVRSNAESNVSVIPGAITKAQFEKEAQQHQQKAIIVYCTSCSATIIRSLRVASSNALL